MAIEEEKTLNELDTKLRSRKEAAQSLFELTQALEGCENVTRCC